MGARTPAIGGKGNRGRSSQGLAILGDLLLKYSNLFLGMFQLKFYIKTLFRHVLAKTLHKNLPHLFIIVHICIKCSILAIIFV